MLNVKCANTPYCWEIHAPFFVTPALPDLSAFFSRSFDLREKKGDRFYIAKGLVRQRFGEPALNFEIGGTVFFVPHSLILSIEDGTGQVWINQSSRPLS